MNIYSGNVRKGKCGDATKLVDYHDKELFVGDIVTIFSVREQDGHKYPLSIEGLTAVVNDMFTSYVGGTHKVTNSEPHSFVMGIASVDFQAKDSDWIVVKVKDHSQMVDGEHWSEYGFSYSND